MGMMDRTKAKKPPMPAPARASSSPPAKPAPAATPAPATPPPTDAKIKRKRNRPGKKVTPGQRDAKSGRLPDGSKFTVVYSAEKQEWSGSLEIPDASIGEQLQSGAAAAGAFHSSASGVFRLLANLDAEYRRFKDTKDPSDAEFTAFVSTPAGENKDEGVAPAQAAAPRSAK